MSFGFNCYDEKLLKKFKAEFIALIKSFFKNEKKISEGFLKDYKTAINRVIQGDENNQSVLVIQDEKMHTELSLSLIMKGGKVWHRLFAVYRFNGDKRAIIFEIELNTQNENMQILDEVNEKLSQLEWVK